MTNKQPEALRLADEVDEVAQTFPDMAEVSAMIRTQHAEIERKDALLRQALDALENHAGNYKLSNAEGTIVSAVVDAITKELSQ